MSDIDKNTSPLFTVFCEVPTCAEDIPVHPESIKNVTIACMTATVTVDLSPAEGKQPVRKCQKDVCGLRFASNTTSDQNAIEWLKTHVSSDRIVELDDTVPVLRRRS